MGDIIMVIIMDTTMGTTTMDLTMGITMDTITDTTMGTAMLEEASTLEEAVVDANVIITSHSKINMEKLMELARELTRQAGYGVTPLDMDVVMLASHRDFLTILGLTKLVVTRVGNKLYYGCLS